MKWAAISLLGVAILSGIACDRKEGVGEKSERSVPLKPSELSAEELDELTASYYRNISEDSSFLESAEYLEVEAAHGPVFKRQLIATIRNAASIMIEEHSDPADFQSFDGTESGNPPSSSYVYRSVKLTEDQKVVFLRAAEAMDNETIVSIPACFKPHHRMEFVRDNGERNFMSICFDCGKVVWADANLFHPKGLFSVLEDVVHAAGLESERDWRGLAKQRSEQNAARQPATRPESE